jgi:hypothetical protein
MEHARLVSALELESVDRRLAARGEQGLPRRFWPVAAMGLFRQIL